MRTIRIAVVAAVVFAGSALAQKTSADVVKVVVKSDKPDADGKQNVTITIDIEKGWHLYANPVGNDMLKSAQTTIKPGDKIELVKVDYPEGKTTKDEVAGDYKTYEGTVVIKAMVRRPADASGPFTLSLRLQACDEKTCKLPSTIKVEVP